MGSPVVHFEIVGKDAPALRSFYRDVFGWEIDQPAVGAGVRDYTLVRPAGDAGIFGGIATAPDGYDGHLTVYVHVPDVAAVLETIVARGGTVLMEPDALANGLTVALFRDPEGHTVGVMQGELG